MFLDRIHAKSNVFITAWERGKRVPSLCHEGHNIWVNFGREYLAKVVSPASGFSGHQDDSVIKYIGLGVGGADQNSNVDTAYPTIAAHYPGQLTYDDTTPTISFLQRPVKVTGTAGVGTAPGVWLKTLVSDATHPTYSGSPASTVEYLALFTETDLHLGGSYPAVPLSEVGLFLSSQIPSRLSNEVYDYGSPPTYINAATRQRLVAYHPFAQLTKTTGVVLEIRWQLQF